MPARRIAQPIYPNRQDLGCALACSDHTVCPMDFDRIRNASAGGVRSAAPADIRCIGAGRQEEGKPQQTAILPPPAKQERLACIQQRPDWDLDTRRIEIPVAPRQTVGD